LNVLQNYEEALHQFQEILLSPVKFEITFGKVLFLAQFLLLPSSSFGSGLLSPEEIHPKSANMDGN